MKFTITAVGVLAVATVLSQPTEKPADSLRDATQEIDQSTWLPKKETNEHRKELHQDLNTAFKKLQKDNQNNIKQLRKDIDENIKQALEPIIAQQ
jgi:molecular chaperone GrpE (heat shock protein)